MDQFLALRQTAACFAWLFLAGCSGVYYSPITNYPGSVLGVVERKTVVGGGPIAYGRDGRPLSVPVPVGGAVIFVPQLPSPRSFLYEVRDTEGTLHIVTYESEFDVGNCVTLTGYAEGPSRTHWSKERIKVSRSEECRN